jgi:hypothetical protein
MDRNEEAVDGTGSVIIQKGEIINFIETFTATYYYL